MTNSGKDQKFLVLIVGGGVGGLTLANALQHAGVDYRILEGRSEIDPQVGASIATFPNGARILDQLGCFDDLLRETHPMGVSTTHYANGDEIVGSPPDMMELVGKRFGYTPTFMERQLMLRILSNHIRDRSKILLNKYVKKVEHHADKVSVYCKDGTVYDGDIVVGADGVSSIVRQEMWRAADEFEPGVISSEEKDALRSEYMCLFGLANPVDSLGSPGEIHMTFSKDLSTMLAVVKGGAIAFFVFAKMDKIYNARDKPKFTEKDAEVFAAQNANIPILPKGLVRFGDIWSKRKTGVLLALEEADFKSWTWGRFACLGDAVHKMTPNAGNGGNSAIESAAALANSIKSLLGDSGTDKPSLPAIVNCLKEYHASRKIRTSQIIKSGNDLTRLHALKDFKNKVMAHYVVPHSGDFAANLMSDTMIGATLISYLPPPSRSLIATMPFNPEQGIGKSQSIVTRALVSSPFLCLALLAHFCCVGNKSNSGPLLLPKLNSTFVESSQMASVYLSAFTVRADNVDGWHNFGLLLECGVVCTICLIESCRRANALTPTRMAIPFLLASQFYGFGVAAPVYCFLHYLTSPIAKFAAADMRLTNIAQTKAALPAVVLGYFAPLLVSYLAPFLETNTSWNLIRKMTSVWVVTTHILLSRTAFLDTTAHDRLYNTSRDLRTIRFTIAGLAALSAIVWLCTTPRSRVPMFNIQVSNQGIFKMVRSLSQIDRIFGFASTSLWLGYLFFDMKRSGMVDHSWMVLLGLHVAITACFGPAAATAAAWLWREEILATRRHKDAVTSAHLAAK
ncbi:uncharacterized protein PAC_15473 [Phialocephala subalpina]|uniref:FAD-binding domain-containing protein n=1 Tax=Phialocephala subalpina TaxID=576137 RepID=A0A1L7XKM9_9HELO|nr:uncharacterized protein PAC_15473 [Phialocephala subalpina]